LGESAVISSCRPCKCSHSTAIVWRPEYTANVARRAYGSFWSKEWDQNQGFPSNLCRFISHLSESQQPCHSMSQFYQRNTISSRRSLDRYQKSVALVESVNAKISTCSGSTGEPGIFTLYQEFLNAMLHFCRISDAIPTRERS
jgi:hypothetical protein